MKRLQLRPFQQQDLREIVRHDYNAVVANAPGTGKTIISLAAYRKRLAEHSPCLVICPSGVVTNWVREAKKWLPPSTRITAVRGSAKTLPRRAHMLVTSWTSLWMNEEVFRQRGFRCVIADEAHYAKNPDTKRHQALARVARGAASLMLLTGTPIINDEQELAVLRSLFPEHVEPALIRRHLEDVAPDVPEKKRTTLPVRLTGKWAQEYKVAEDDFQTWLEQVFRERMSAGEASQAAETALMNEALLKIGYLRRLVGRAKVDAAADWTDRLVRRGEPVVVFAEHMDAIKRFSQHMRRRQIPYGRIVGKTSRKKRDRAVDLFQAGKLPVLIGSKAAKEGITLHRARHLLFIERWWTSADEEQAEDRIRRIGQTRKSYIWFLHGVGTVDDRLDQIVRTKRRLIDYAIGNVNVSHLDTGIAERLIQAWGEDLSPSGQVLPLGRDQVVPLPPRRRTSILTFRGPRWDETTAVGWCRMLRYPVSRITTSREGIRVFCRRQDDFIPGTYFSVPVSRTVTAVCASLA